jgi:hypothetical protein
MGAAVMWHAGSTQLMFVHLQEIYPGSKTEHFSRIHNATSIPYTQMVCPRAVAASC